MNNKTVVILLLAILALSTFAMIQIKPVKAAETLTLSDDEMMLSEFMWLFDPGSSLTGKTNVAGPGVQFDLAGLGKAGIGDNYPVNQLAGGALYDGHYSDFTAYDKYSMLFVNVGSGTIQVSLYMDTGFTDSPGRDWHYDTFWCSNWVTLGPHQSAVVTLDFSASGQAWNIADDPQWGSGHTDGESGTPIWRLNEVTNIGFQVLGSGTASVIVSGTFTLLYIVPPETHKTKDDVCTTFDVYVTIENFHYLAGFDIKLTWDSNLITETAHDYETYLTTLWGGPKGTKWTVIRDEPVPGSYRLAVAALATSASDPGATVLLKKTFHVDRSCNFPLQTAIHFELAKLSDDNGEPIPATLTDGMYYISETRPDLEFKVQKWNKVTQVWEYIVPPYNFEFCDNLRIEVYVSHIHDCSLLTDYHLKIQYSTHLTKFLNAEEWGLGWAPGTSSETTPGEIDVSNTGLGWSGEEGLLFALKFHVEFANIEEHVWKKGSLNYETFVIDANSQIIGATLSFDTRGITFGGIDIPTMPLTIKVNFIRGDVRVDGKVNMDDIGDAAYYYDKTSADPDWVLLIRRYDLNNDNIVDIFDIVSIATNFGYGM
jgi:hypothetical protein